MKEEISLVQQANIITKGEMSSIEAPSSIMVKEAFYHWLSDGHAKKYLPSVYLSCIDKVSAYLMRRKISSIDLWQITNFELFKSIYNEAISDKLFKATDKKTHFTFIHVGKAFLKFLKSKPLLYENSGNAPAVTLEPPSKPSSRLTIREAIIRVLGNEPNGMTSEQIYSKIIADGLYSFGAQNPRNVVRVELERACEKTNYTVRASKNCFRFERNQKRDKVYFLLATTPTNDTAQPSFIADSELDDIVDLEEGKKCLCEILDTHFLTLYGYSNIGILWSAAQNSLSMFLNDNAINSADDLWCFLIRAFKNEFVFNSPHIWKNPPDYPQSSKGLIINLARQHGGVVTREQIDNFFSQIKLTSLYNSFVLDKEQLLFYDKAKFILTETVNPNADRCSLIANALNTLFSFENMPYIILRDIKQKWFSSLPGLPNGLPWTPLLLQELLRIRPNIGYRVILPSLKGQALDRVGAAIVPRKSDIETFADVVHLFCFGEYKLPYKLPAEELRLKLREASMIEGNELIYNMHKALKDYRFAFSDENRTVMILER